MWKATCFVLLFFARGLSEGLAFSSLQSVVSGKKVVVVGGGPVGLYFAALMSYEDPSVQIEILEKRAAASVNAFGLGVGHRMQNRLKDVPGLYERATSISARVDSLGIPLVSRDDLTQQMSSFVLDKFSENCRLTLGEECASVDLKAKTINTSSGRTIDYDLLLGADGVNSRIRHCLLKESACLKEEHYLEAMSWKALKLPKQPDIDVGSFKPLRHPSIAGGRVLPKAPEGHILLMAWTDEHAAMNNPEGVETIEDLKEMVTEAVQDKKTSRFRNPLRKLLGLEQGDSVKKDRKVVFDEDALTDFLASRAGRSHHLQVNQYHHQDSVALIGDSAHSFNSLLGQGCATGLESTHTLVESLLMSPTLGDALSNYTQVATAEAHAMTELSLINYAARGGLSLMTIKAMPLILWNMVRGRGLLKRITDINVPFSTIAAENRRLLKMCRRQFEKERRPYAEDS